MADQIFAGEAFQNGQQVDATRLNDHVGHAKLLKGAILEQDQQSLVKAVDEILIVDIANDKLNKLHVGDVLLSELPIITNHIQTKVEANPLDAKDLNLVVASGHSVNVTGDFAVSGSVGIAGELYIKTAAVSSFKSPVATIIMSAASAVPDGWLKCNGAVISRALFPELFAAIGVVYGPGDGLTTFKLPDLRGEFIRGLDDGRGIDTGRTLGSSQGDLLKKHKHNAVNSDCQDYSGVQGLATGQKFNTWCDTNGINWNGAAPLTGDGTHGIEIGIAGTSIGVVGEETRPRNIALIYLIKY